MLDGDRNGRVVVGHEIRLKEVSAGSYIPDRLAVDCDCGAGLHQAANTDVSRAGRHIRAFGR